MNILAIFMLLVLGAAGENLENYDHELSTIKLLYYRPTMPRIDDPIEIAEEWKNDDDDDIIDARTDVKLLIHGWNADADHVALATVRNAYLKLNSSYLLMADWRDIANMRYFVARQMIASVGRRLCELLKIFMVQAKLGPDSVHVVGHSLGAHIATHTGRCFDGEIARMTALDPAGPLFTPFSTDALSKNDFQFVDSIHTSAGLAGEFEIRGQADFFPNQGRAPQPGCETLDIFTVSGCSHYRAPLFFAESILVPHSFYAYQCDLSLIQLPTYRNCLNASNVVLMGEHIDRETSGVFYLETFGQFPYGKGPVNGLQPARD